MADGLATPIRKDTDLLSATRKAFGKLDRTPMKLPTIQINKEITNIDEFTFDDFTVIDYEHHPHIKAPISI